MMNVLDAIPVTHEWTPELSLCRDLYSVKRAVLIKFYTLLLPILVAVAALTGVFVRWVDPSPQLVTAWLCAMTSGLLLIAHYWSYVIAIPSIPVPPKVLQGITWLPVIRDRGHTYLSDRFVEYLIGKPSFWGNTPYQHLCVLVKILEDHDRLKRAMTSCVSANSEQRSIMLSVAMIEFERRSQNCGINFLADLRTWAEDFLDR